MMTTIAEAYAIAMEHHRAGRLAVAEEVYRRILAVEPEAAEVTLQLGLALEGQGRLDAAADCYRRAAELKPDMVEAHYDLGNLLRTRGHAHEALPCLERAIALKPDLPQAHLARANTLLGLGQFAAAVDGYRRALEVAPAYAEAHNNQGVALQSLGQLDEALACYQRAIRQQPDYAEAWNNLGQVLQSRAELDEAIAAFRQAVQLRSDSPYLHSNLIYALNFSPRYDAAAIGQEARAWCQRHAAPWAGAVPPHRNDRSPERRLRVGYVSPNLREHPVGRFLLPLLESHDRERFQIFCYASVPQPDALTDALRAHADAWHDVTGQSDEQLAQHIAAEQIDILVDLTMHMQGHRLLAFARRPAPVQVTYLAYCGTTGLDAMDYRLTDPHLDPPGVDERCYSEQSVRLPHTYWCYRPMPEAPPVCGPPSASTGRVTFGSLNNFSKVSPAAIEAWGRVLQAVPNSRLLLHSQSGSHRDRARDALARLGVASDRLEFVDLRPAADYFRLYQRIDVALDPFPYSGGTTTCDALWMGVPVVSLAGRTAVGRGGASLLANAGLGDLVATTVEQYVAIAARLAADDSRRASLRADLRGRMQASPLMDAAGFARSVENAYRTMWRHWCEQSSC
jgi:predicted O-linked N-acetylglucosamine transferase (SPINDLY family)